MNSHKDLPVLFPYVFNSSDENTLFPCEYILPRLSLSSSQLRRLDVGVE